MTQATTTADPGGVLPDGPTLEAIDRWISYRVWHTRTPGAQVAIGVRGRSCFSRAYGYADLQSRTPMRNDHLFRIASHSKTFTATLVLQLVEQGLLGLDEPVGDHVPGLAEPLAGVRLQELLEHTGGVLRDGRDADYWQHRRDFPDRGELLALAEDGGLKSGPGEHFAYSNLGYSLLGLVVEKVTGQTYADAARTRICEPLALSDTAAEYVEERADDYAAGHSGLHTAAQRHAIDHVVTYAMAAATGFTSTATDLVSYFTAHALGDERLLSDRTKRLQQRRANDTDVDDPAQGGYGWGLITEAVDDTTYVGHSGGYPGHITKTLLDPTTGLVVSVLTNAIDGPAALLARGIAQLLAEARRRPAATTPLSVTALARTGRYASEWAVLDLAAVGGRLRTIVPTTWTPMENADEVVEHEPDQFRIAAGNGYGSVREPVTFTTETDQPDGPVTEMRYGGMSMHPLVELEEPEGYRSGA